MSAPSIDSAPLEKQIAHWERLAAEKLDEIMELQQLLSDEQDKTARYSQQIDEMTDFLADYGLTWVGGEAPTPKSVFPRGPTDMQLFERKIQELNDMAESGVSFTKESGVTKVSEKAIKIRLKEDGFCLDDGELRPYSNPLSSDFFQDIMDGFFPLEFKDKYPEGVRLVVEDLRTNNLFKGKARKLSESLRREERTSKPIDWSQELGDGPGRLKVKVSTGGELLVRTTKEDVIGHIRELIIAHCGFEKFDLVVPPSTQPVSDDKTVGDLALFPRGLVLLNLR